jgi:hypothetical protein
MKTLSKDLRDFSGQVGDNARERLDLPDIESYERIGGPVQGSRKRESGLVPGMKCLLKETVPERIRS